MKNLTVGYKLVKNNTTTAAQAPYLGMAVPFSSLAIDDIIAEVCKINPSFSEAEARLMLYALFELAAEILAEMNVRISVGAFSLYPATSGSFDSEDADFDPERNELYVGASLSQEIREAVGEITPRYVGAEAETATLKMSSVMDVTTKEMGVINGTNQFCIAGINLTVPDGSDESLVLANAEGSTVAEITVSSNDGGQWLKCSLSQYYSVPVGNYYLLLKSHGLDPTDPLTTCRLKVAVKTAVAGPIGTSTDGKVRIMTLGTLTASGAAAMTGKEVGYNQTTSLGLIKASATVGGKTLVWDAANTSTVEATSGSLTLESGQELPEDGEYTADVTIVRNVTGGTVENIVLKNRAIEIVSE